MEISKKHKEIVLSRMQYMEENPEHYLSWDDIESNIKL